MGTFCSKCTKHTKDIDPQISSTINGKLMILSKCILCNKK